MFITFEGPEGSGKTRQAAALADFLRQQGYDVLLTREPGGTQIGDQIRAILSDLKNVSMRPRTETLLFQASRAQLVEEVIRPRLEIGGLVLSDRYADSTLAYQGYGHCFDLDELRALIRFATGGLSPDLTLLLDVEVETGLRRKMSGGEWNRLDAYDLEFHRRVRAGFLELARLEPHRWVLIDAGQPPDAVQAAVREVVMERLPARPKRA
ncbi:MAG: dTMP kinase [Anaerolineales bacterium]|nr:dTMP kinase [Anaerolineales bacterium]